MPFAAFSAGSKVGLGTDEVRRSLQGLSNRWASKAGLPSGVSYQPSAVLYLRLGLAADGTSLGLSGRIRGNLPGRGCVARGGR